MLKHGPRLSARARLLRCLTPRLALWAARHFPGGGGAGHWTHSHCLGCSTEPPLKVSDSTAFWHQVGGALRDAWRGLKSGMDDMKSGMDGELQIARFAELQDELELLGIPQERE